MNRAELLALIENGENSRVEFKRDDARAGSVAKEISALLNFEGGFILLGVEDDGEITGMNRSRNSAEEWVMNIARQNITPAVVPSWTTIQAGEDKRVGVIELQADSPGKPFKARHSRAWVTFIRVGSTSREATREEEGRLYQAGQLTQYELRPVLDADLGWLDFDRIEDYFSHVLNRRVPDRDKGDEWRRILLNCDLLVDTSSGLCPTVAGLLLFGKNPYRRLRQAGVTAAAFAGIEKEYNTIDEEVIRGPLVRLGSTDRLGIYSGMIDRAIEFVTRNMKGVAWLEAGQRRQRKAYPLDAVREAVVNAVVHRDYAREWTDIEVSLYDDRLEIISPGRLPNGVTVEKMKEGVVRVARNALMKEILRDYGYVEHFGMGVRNRIIKSMLDHNGSVPDLVEEEDRFIVRLWSQK